MQSPVEGQRLYDDALVFVADSRAVPRRRDQVVGHAAQADGLVGLACCREISTSGIAYAVVGNLGGTLTSSGHA